MSQPVTTNPWIIMLINMTVVFLVLILLGLVINLIHRIDPTKKKAVGPEVDAMHVQAEQPVVAETASEKGISPEVVAVIAAAVASYGYGMEQIHAIRPIERDGWKISGRHQLVQRV